MPSLATVKTQLEALPEEYRAPSLRLLEYLRRHPGGRFDANRLVTAAQAPTRELLMGALLAMSRLGVVKPIVVVYASPERARVIDEIPPGRDVPERIRDGMTRSDVDVSAENIDVVYDVEALR